MNYSCVCWDIQTSQSYCLLYFCEILLCVIVGFDVSKVSAELTLSQTFQILQFNTYIYMKLGLFEY